MIILGIESSCDETAAAVVLHGKEILSNVIHSQIDVHSEFGGVVPELASRKHVEWILPVIQRALHLADLSMKDIEGIAVTQGPGLVGSLLIGISVAKSIAYVQDIPLIGVNHIEGHIFSIFLEEEEVDFPFIALVASGGHTSLYLVVEKDKLSLLGQTRDDAAGEAFDKVAKLLNLGYPGGVVIERLAKEGNSRAIDFPRAMLSENSFDFSFSGIKTAVLNYVKGRTQELISQQLPDIAASFQEAIIDVLVAKSLKAAEAHNVQTIVLAGGVASNTRLRTKLKEEAKEKGILVFAPSPVLCTDNGAMIAAVGEMYFNRGERSTMTMNAVSRWPK